MPETGHPTSKIQQSVFGTRAHGLIPYPHLLALMSLQTLSREGADFELESLPRHVYVSPEPTIVEASVTSTAALESEHQREEEAVALPPVDRGFYAWKFVLCAFVLEFLVWGFPLWSGTLTLPPDHDI